MSDNDPALQLGLDYSHDSGFFVGAWASTIDLESTVSERDYELDYYAGYHYEFLNALSASVTLIRYTFPGQSGPRDYDYNEALFGVGLFDHYSIELGYTGDLYGLGIDSHHWEVRGEWPVANAWVIGAALGRNDLSDAGGSRYYYWDVGASARFSRVIVDVRWFDNEKPYGFAGSLSADSRFVVSLSLPF